MTEPNEGTSLYEMLNGNKIGKKPAHYIKIVDKNLRNESLIEKETKDKNKKTDNLLIGNSSSIREQSLTNLLGRII